MSVVLRELQSGKQCRIFALTKTSSEGKSSSPYYEFLKSLVSAGEKSIINKVRAKLQLIADEGPIQNTSAFRMLQGKNERDIWEMVLGNFRLFMFRDKNNWICLNGFRKSSNKTPRKQIKHAIALRAEYFHNKDHGKLQILRKR